MKTLTLYKIGFLSFVASCLFLVTSVQAEDNLLWEATDKQETRWVVKETPDKLEIFQYRKDGKSFKVESGDYTCSAGRSAGYYITTLDVHVGGIYYLFVNKTDLDDVQSGSVLVSSKNKSFNSLLVKVGGALCTKHLEGENDG